MKKAEIQIQESILVIFFFIIIFIVGFILFYQFTLLGIKNDIESYKAFTSEQLVVVIPSMGEFRCSFLGTEDECIDIGKVIAFERLDDSYLKKDFGNRKIILQVVYPRERNREYEIYSNVPRRYDSKKILSSLISIYDPKEDTFKVGNLVIEEYL